MPIKEILYICEICGKNFHKENLAKECENNHFTVKEIVSVNYNQYENKKQFPSSINVKLANKNGRETIVTYNRK